MVCIENDYLIYELHKNDKYYVNYKLLKKCDKDAWIKLLEDNEINKYDFNALIDNNDILSDNEENFIIDNNQEFL